jgi:spermidine synthase
VPVLLLLCFVISGASSLVFEVVWSRQLANVFGSSSLAISTVLATFMGGLALGSVLGGRIADRFGAYCLWLYAGCEAGIALLALVVPAALGGYPAANAALWRYLHDAPALLALLRFGLCALVLLPPTVLMGATLPILSRHVVRSAHELGQLGLRVGALYAANTLGAVVGAGGAGFYLLPLFGQRTTYLVAVVADLALAGAIVVALLWRRRHPRRELAADLPPNLAGQGDGPDDPSLGPDARPGVLPLSPPELPSGARSLVLVAVAASGAMAMSLEVLWSRALALVIGSSVYSFTLVLVVFLLGLSVGATWIGRPAARARRPLAALAVIYVAVGASVVLTHQVIDELPPLFVSLLVGTDLDVSTVIAFQTLCAALAVAPTAACLGAVMPLTMRAYAGAVSAVGRDVGRAYAANTLGAIVGSFAGGFLILPLIGLERGIRALAVAMLALAAGVALRSASRRVARVVPAAALVLGLVAVASPRWDLGIMTSGVFRVRRAVHFAETGRIPNADVVYYEDGIATTVSVERYSPAGEAQRFALKNNGKVEASSVGDMPTQVLVGLIPILAKATPAQRVAVVGYGSGITVGAIAESPLVDRVDVIELEPKVLEAADRWFGPHNHEAHRNPKVKRWIGDGRNFLTAYPEKYDVIVSEPSNPWIAGVSSLFTREFYAFAKGHLAPGGIYCQWAQLYELGPRHVKAIYRTFAEAFPYVYAFSAGDLSADTILVGSLTELRLDVPTWERGSSDPATAAELRRGGVTSALELLALVIMTPTEVPAFTAGAPINTDDNALLEFGAPRDLLASGRSGGRFADGIFSNGWPYGHLGETVTGLGDGEARALRERELARALLHKGKRREASAWMERARTDGADVTALTLLHRAVKEREWHDPEVAPAAGGPPLPRPDPSWFDPHLSEDERRAAAARLAGLDNLMAVGKGDEALAMLGGLPDPAPGEPGWNLTVLKGAALYRLLDFVAARRVLADVVDDDAATRFRPALLYYYGRVVYGDGDFEVGAELLERFCARWPELVPP